MHTYSAINGWEGINKIFRHLRTEQYGTVPVLERYLSRQLSLSTLSITHLVDVNRTYGTVPYRNGTIARAGKVFGIFTYVRTIISEFLFC